jgi:hypothetical protein
LLMLSSDSPSLTLASKLLSHTERHSLKSGVAPSHSGIDSSAKKKYV